MSAACWARRRSWQRVRILLRRTGRWEHYRPTYKAARSGGSDE